MIATLNVIGAGKLGRTLSALWVRNKTLSVQQLFGPTPPREAAEFIGAGSAASLETKPKVANIWLLSCPDDQINAAAEWLCNARVIQPGNLVFHCSGSLSSQALAPLAHQGALIASVHPAHAFADPEKSLTTFAGTLCCAEGDEGALARLKPLFGAIGGQWQPLDADRKALYHAATVAASNYLVTTLHLAKTLATSAGLDDHRARVLLAPLATQALDNALKMASTDALTGPISRGDSATIENHWQALSEDKARQALYHSLARATLALAREQSFANQDKLNSIDALLSQWQADISHNGYE